VEERLLDEAAYYYWFADRFGWTPDAVDRQSAIRLRRLMVVGDVVAEVAEEKRRAESR